MDRLAVGGSWGRTVRLLAFGVTALLVPFGLVVGVMQYQAFDAAGALWIDHVTYSVFALRWWETGSQYLAYQVAGPFDPQPLPHVPPVMPSMYPPTAVLLFAPFALLPSILWWAVPLGLLVWEVARWRPAPWTWPVLAVLLYYPPVWATLWTGNTTMWIAAALALGLGRGWGGPLILLKPSLAPFALAGAWRRAWWVAALALAAVSLPFVAEWLRYVDVVRNAEMSLAYSVGTVPILVVMGLAWWARATPNSAPRTLPPTASSGPARQARRSACGQG